MKHLFLSSVALLFLQGALHAEYTNFDLSLKAGLTSIDNEDGWSFDKGTFAFDGTVDLGYVIKPRLDLVYVNIDEEKSVDSLWQMAVDGVYDFDLYPDYPIDLYLFGGLGYEYVSGSRKGFESQFFVQGGAGVLYPVNKNFSLVTEFKALQMIDSSGSDEDNEFVVLVGASMPFHIETRLPDADGDGVLNADDLCPNTPPGVRVNPDGCPVAVKTEKAAPKPKPEPTPEVVPAVETTITPVEPLHEKVVKVSDEDGDGVADSLDQCPNTPAGFSVDKKGCGVKKRLEVHFESNEAKLTADSMQKIKAFAAYLKRMPNVTVTIEGYTDSSGDMKQNMKLSQERALAVKKALISFGIKPNRITAVGKGPLNPIADNDTPQGRAKNRRIEAIIHQ
jgi:OOP family OmpA-OmpF porin